MSALTEIAWWCSGTLGQPWRWEYRPLVGVWLLVALLAGAYVWALRRHVAATGGTYPATRHYAWRFGAGLALLVVSSDWPLGPLGAGYLASVAAVRTLLLTFGVAPLLLLGTPPWMLRRLLRAEPDTRGRHSRVLTVARALTLPWVAFLLFNAMLTLVYYGVSRKYDLEST